MANLGTITYTVRVDTSDLDRANRKMGSTKKTTDGLGRSTDTLGKKFKKAGTEGKLATDKLGKGMTTATTAIDRAKQAAAALIIALATRKIFEYSDAWNNASNQLRQVTETTEELQKAQRNLLNVANETRSSFESTAVLFSRLKRSTTELRISDERLLAVTRTISQTFATSGATTQEATSAIIQLTQGLAAGALRGQEYNSVLEQAPGIARAIAKSLNLTLGELRLFANEGKITAEIVVNAIEQSAEALDVKFNKTIATFGQNMTIANNKILEFVGNSNELQTTVTALGAAVVILADNIEVFADLVVIGAAAMAIKYAPALLALLNPIGLAVAAVLGLVLAFRQLARIQEEAFSAAVGEAIEQGIKAIDIFLLKTEMSIGALEAERDALGTNRAERNKRLVIESKLIKQNEVLNELQTARNALLEEEIQLTKDDSVAVGVLTTRLSGLKTKYTQLTGVMIPLNTETMLMNTSLLDMDTVITNLRVGSVPGYSDTLRDMSFRMEGVKVATKAATKEIDFQKNMIENVQREWGNLFFDLLEGEATFKDFFTAITDAFKRMVAEMAAAKLVEAVFGGGGLGGLTSGLSSLFGGGGGTTTGGGVGGGIFSTLASSGGLIGGAGQFLGGLFGSATGVAAGTVGPPTAAAMAGSGVSAGLAALAANPLTWVAAALAVGAANDWWEDPDDFKRANLGFLTAPTPGADPNRTFGIDPFASGFQGQGFARRGSQADAIGVIDKFREIDLLITQATRAAGGVLDLSKATLGGLGEEGLFGTDGTFLGIGSATKDLTKQLDFFAQQLADNISGLTPETMARLVGATSASEIVSILEELTASNLALVESNDEVLKTNVELFHEQEQRDARAPLDAANERLQAFLDEPESRFQPSFGGGFSVGGFGVSSTQTPEEFFTSRAQEVDDLTEIFRNLRFIGLSHIGAAGISVEKSREMVDIFKSGDTSRVNAFVKENPDIAARSGFQGTDGSFQSGLDRVPFDGFIAELHQGERVMTSSQADQQDAANQEGGPGRGNIANMLFQLLKSVFRTSRIIRRWDRNGLPPERTA